MACQDRSIVNQELKLASEVIYRQCVRDDLAARNLAEDEFRFVVAQDRNVINFANGNIHAFISRRGTALFCQLR